MAKRILVIFLMLINLVTLTSCNVFEVFTDIKDNVISEGLPKVDNFNPGLNNNDMRTWVVGSTTEPYVFNDDKYVYSEGDLAGRLDSVQDFFRKSLNDNWNAIKQSAVSSAGEVDMTALTSGGSDPGVFRLGTETTNFFNTAFGTDAYNNPKISDARIYVTSTNMTDSTLKILADNDSGFFSTGSSIDFKIEGDVGSSVLAPVLMASQISSAIDNKYRTIYKDLYDLSGSNYVPNALEPNINLDGSLNLLSRQSFSTSGKRMPIGTGTYLTGWTLGSTEAAADYGFSVHGDIGKMLNSMGKSMSKPSRSNRKYFMNSVGGLNNKVFVETFRSVYKDNDTNLRNLCIRLNVQIGDYAVYDKDGVKTGTEKGAVMMWIVFLEDSKISLEPGFSKCDQWLNAYVDYYLTDKMAELAP